MRFLSRAGAGASAFALAAIAIALACSGCGGATSGAAESVPQDKLLTAPVPGGTSAGNLQLGPESCTNVRCARRKRVMVRWVAHHTGKLQTLYLEFKANVSQPSNCVSAANGYGGGTSGIALVQTFRVRASGKPDLAHKVAETRFNPCKVATDGSVPIPLGFKVVKGREFATIVRNVDPDPMHNFFSVNTLFDSRGIAGANGRNTRSARTQDVFYGLDPRELVVTSRDGGASWRFGDIHHLPTYVERYADGFRAGQPYLYPTCPCPGAVSGEATMVFPHVPHTWIIRQLGAYTVGPGEAQVDLRVDGKIVRTAILAGTGMLRAPITPVTVKAGSTVSVRTLAGDGGLALQRVDADTPWKQGPVLDLGRHYRFFYLEQQGGGAADEAAVTVYPLPMYPIGG